MINKSLKIFIFGIAILLNQPTYSLNQKKVLQAKRTNEVPIIDGALNDKAWVSATIATNFIQIEPYNGSPASQKSEVKFIYDDEAIYIAAMLYDTAPDSIVSELSKRDDLGISDNFGIHIDPFNDASIAYSFSVNPAGVQMDAKVGEDSRHDDKTWDAVWESKTQVVENGWIVEIRIPYSALRFPKKDIQRWGINFLREIKRYKEIDSWNFVDKEIAGTKTQAGEIEGISNIIPPLRLSAVPYLSGYIENNGENIGWGKSYGYGMDVKLGINESFTLDATLIPDFSQVQSDDKIVNLSPFETFYQERRPFFTEGTELFNRNDRIFYSRRVGTKPINYNSVKNEYDQDKVISNPETTQLINATKISGKTHSGLGLGIFNAMTSNTYAKVIDELGNEKQYLTQPFTNYNMVVVDQSLKNNSFVSFYNTNVYRGSNEYMANVTGTEVRFVDKSNYYAVSGHFHLSQKYNPKQDNVFGHSYQFSVGKISGKFKYNYSQSAMNDTYDHNDLGYLSHNNNLNHDLNFSYNEYRPFWKVMDMSNSISFEHSTLYKPRKFSRFSISTRSRTTLRNYTSLNLNTTIEPKGSDDYFEPRVDGWVYKEPASHNFNFFISPDYRKKYVTDIKFNYTGTTEKGRNSILFSLSQRIRISDQFNMIITSEFKNDNKSYGYVNDSINTNNNQVIIFGQRDVRTVTNTIESSYIFNNKSSLSLRLRHYWIRAQYHNYYDLQVDGSLIQNNFKEDNDFNVNAFNIDMVYTWNFAPGSELLLVYKNAIYANVDSSVNNYFDNLRYTFDSPIINSFSIKILYYIDYLNIKKNKRK
ncbi:MAG: carbohydrate binding family 9 domain-containing protein [Bacteroidetes bacterium]|nr:carbohydrate binding family 9 domain-containing protein [Bacteroidota bacterium]